MNKIIITGNLCKDIDLRYTPSNVAVVQNTVAVRNDFKNANGEHDSEFINIVLWRQAAEFLSKYAAKGSKVLVEGRLTNRSYDKQDGTKGYITEVVADKVELLDAKKKENATNEKQDAPAQKEQSDPFKEFANEVILTDAELPF
ncbi:MAG: single-stranded DNA-binding protein [Bacilli bacterium]|nr:single-stranded DNA-binding protein [Bacilli bacterium]